MGFDRSAFQQLASSDVDVAHARLPAFWFERGRTPSGQRVLSRGKCGADFLSAAATDGCNVAQHLCRGTVCAASAARGVRRVGGGTEGCPEHVFWIVDDLGICTFWGEPSKGAEGKM